MACNWCISENISKLSYRFGHLIPSWLKTQILEINLRLWIHRRREQRGETDEFVLKDAFFLLSHLDEFGKWWLNTDPAEIYLNLRSVKVLDDEYLLCATVSVCFRSETSDRTFGTKKPQKLQRNVSVSSNKATAEYSKSRERKYVPAECMHVCCMSSKKKERKENWTAFTAPLQIHCVTQIWQRLTFSISSPRQ